MHLTYVLLQVSWIGSSDFGLCLCSGPIAASLVNRYGCRLVTILGTIISVLATIMATMAPNISYMIVSEGPHPSRLNRYPLHTIHRLEFHFGSGDIWSERGEFGRFPIRQKRQKLPLLS